MKHFLSFLLILSIMTGCSSSEEPDFSNNPRKNVELSRVEQECCARLGDFNVEILKAASAETDKNVVLSPLSMAMCLSMRANFASPELAGQIYRALGTENLEALNSLNCKMMAELKKLDKATTIDLANGLWYNERLSPGDGLASTLKDNYRADVFACNPAKAPAHVCDWVKKKSKGLIDYTPDAFDILVANVLYFKGLWKDEFSEYRTKKAKFHGKNGNTKVDMMYKAQSELFAAGDNFEVCKKPFGNGAFYCYFVLPNEGVDIDGFTQSLTSLELASLEYKSYPAALYVPRFELRSTIDNLIPVLERLGIVGFENEGSYAEKVVHETYLKVDESGAEVAAITEDELVWIAPDISGVWEFNLDRPFLVFIDEGSTGACIMAAKIVDL